jgi:hypothetical protein
LGASGHHYRYICNYAIAVHGIWCERKKGNISMGFIAFGSSPLACNPYSDRNNRSYAPPFLLFQYTQRLLQLRAEPITFEEAAPQPKAMLGASSKNVAGSSDLAKTLPVVCII